MVCGFLANEFTPMSKSANFFFFIIIIFVPLAARGPPAAMRMPSSRHCWGPNVYPEVPEGGWGWAVAAAFFVVEVCTYGTIKSLGVFLQDLMDEYGESNSRVSWIISICVFIFSFTGGSPPP